MDEVVREARDKGYGRPLISIRATLTFVVLRSGQPSTSHSGSAADILKIAMIQLDKSLVEGGYQTKDAL